MRKYNIPLAIYLLRIIKNKTQADLSNESGVRQDYISRIEKNKKKPSIDTCEKLLKALNVDFSLFFQLAENIPGKEETNKAFIEDLIDNLKKEEYILTKLKNIKVTN